MPISTSTDNATPQTNRSGQSALSQSVSSSSIASATNEAARSAFGGTPKQKPGGSDINEMLAKLQFSQSAMEDVDDDMDMCDDADNALVNSHRDVDKPGSSSSSQPFAKTHDRTNMQRQALFDMPSPEFTTPSPSSSIEAPHSGVQNQGIREFSLDDRSVISPPSKSSQSIMHREDFSLGAPLVPSKSQHSSQHRVQPRASSSDPKNSHRNALSHSQFSPVRNTNINASHTMKDNFANSQELSLFQKPRSRSRQHVGEKGAHHPTRSASGHRRGRARHKRSQGGSDDAGFMFMVRF